MSKDFQPFLQLHNHSFYSIRDGLASPEEYVEYCYNHKIPSCSITDHGNIGGLIRQYTKCEELGIKPIFGCEVYLNNYRNNQEYREDTKREEYKLFKKNNHLILLAKNFAGYKNLIKITSDAWINGFYYRPRTSMDFIESRKEGLICLTSCISGEVSSQLELGNYDKSKEILLGYKTIFGPDLYVELLLVETQLQITINNLLSKLAKECDIKTVITNDCHYLMKEDNTTHDILLMIRDNKTMKDLKDNPNGVWKFECKDLYYKDFSDMYKSFLTHKSEYFTESVFSNSYQNVHEIDNKIEKIKLDTRLKLPKIYDNSKEVLVDKINKGYKKRKIDKFSEEEQGIYKQRMSVEFDVITELGFTDYFLILEDILNWAKANDVFVGSSRGSAGGSLICYLLEITNLDPIKYGLLFERFLSKSRGAGDIPDIDSDFDAEDRDRVKEYIFEKFGKDKTCSIGTYGYMKTKSVMLDIGRVLNIDLAETMHLTKNVLTQDSDDMTIEQIEGNFDEVYRYWGKYPEAKRLFPKLRNKIKNMSKHAAGVIISDSELSENIALTTQNNNILSAWQEGSDYHELAKVGFIKFDILGLNNLTVIKKAMKFIKQRHNVDVVLDNMNYNDKDVYNSVKNGDMVGIFQFESGIAKELINLIKPESFNQLSACNALLRPGPIRMGMHKEFAERKNGKKIFTIPECLKDILEETFGIICYQEQFMLIAQKFGFSQIESNKFRKTLVKSGKSFEFEAKREQEAKSYHDKFIEGSKTFLNKDGAENLWNNIISFISYGFNKCIYKDSSIDYYCNLKENKITRISIEQLYNRFKRGTETYINSYVNGKFIPIKVKNVYETGIKKCYKLSCEGRRSIISSKDHKFLTHAGWKKLSELEIEEEIFLRSKRSDWGNIMVTPRIREIRRQTRIKTNKTLFMRNASGKQMTKTMAKRVQSGEASAHTKKMHKDGVITKEHVKDWTAAGKKQMQYLWIHNKEEMLKKCWEPWHKASIESGKRGSKGEKKLFEYLKELLPLGEWKRHQVYKIFGINRQIDIMSNKYNCYIEYDGKIHREMIYSQEHFESVKKADLEKNIFIINNKGGIMIRVEEHKPNDQLKVAKQIVNSINNNSLYKDKVNTFFNCEGCWSKIIEIKKYGKAQTYDIEVDNKEHNYVANGIVVHNSHSFGYSNLSFQEMWFKHYYFIEFITALIDSTPRAKEGRNTSSVLRDYVNYARRKGITVLSPDINKSNHNFTILDNKTIIWGFSHIKSLGNVTEKIVKNRPYISFEDFLKRAVIKDSGINKGKVESLIYSGAFDCFNKNRNELLRIYRQSRKEIFTSLTNNQIKEMEIDTISICLSQDILSKYDILFNRLHHLKTPSELLYREELSDDFYEEERSFTIMGKIDSIEKRKTKKMSDFFIVKIYDNYGSLVFFMWDEQIETFKHVINEGSKNEIIIVKLVPYKNAYIMNTEDVLLETAGKFVEDTGGFSKNSLDQDEIETIDYQDKKTISKNTENSYIKITEQGSLF